jgi:hypothetical protein|tara:strand:- start:326 stop:505 length:180 start_codon:yes stop_codon:yes gene_type:complete
MFKEGQTVRWFCESSYEWLTGTIKEITNIELDGGTHKLYKVKINGGDLRWAGEDQLKLP